MKLIDNMKTLVENSKRVMNVSYRPTEQEFKKSAKVIILGILIIGVLGLIIAIIISLIVTGSLALI
ncbi:MAG: protein translocase SEC61 complex subunit gamma [Candidatus Marsarchaeota archaeon]|jgi:protein transport protein SEC61 subunit gamma-like protein|nr:protein translocase SEC61 complex subunit gamma [Candidatus Marsarchaeota archaeon]MCL5431115.1 protein translocase SEC61 complex subunit gamma [Candidatus Marsarchaeota archaeon]